MAYNNQTENVQEWSDEKVVTPSIFDNDNIKDLKAIFAEIVAKISETLEDEKIKA